MQLDLLIPFLVPIFTIFTVLTATWLPPGPRLGIASSFVSLLLDHFDVFAAFRDDSPELYDMVVKYGRRPDSPPSLIASILSPRAYKSSTPTNTTCQPRLLDPTSGLFMSIDTTPYYGVSLYGSQEGLPWAPDNPPIHLSDDPGRTVAVGLAAVVIGLVYYLRLVRDDSRTRTSTAHATIEDLERAVRCSELCFVEHAAALDRYPSVLTQIGEAIASYSEAEAELDARVECEYDQIRLHEEDVVNVMEHNGRLEAEYDSLQRRGINHRKDTSDEEDKSTEEYVKLLAELEEAEALLETAEQTYAEQFAVVSTIEHELATASSARDTCAFEHDVLEKQVEYLERLDMIKQKDHEGEVANLKASHTEVEANIVHALERVENGESTAAGLEQAIEHAISIAHHTEEVLRGDIDAALATVLSLEADESGEAARYSDLVTVHDTLQATHQSAVKEADELTAEALWLDSEVEDLRSQAVNEDKAHVADLISFEGDLEVLTASQATLLEELDQAKVDLAGIKDDSRIALAAVYDAHASAEAEHKTAILSLQESIAFNDIRLTELQATQLSWRQELAAKQAELDARLGIFDKEGFEHYERIEASMEHTKDAALEEQSYQSMYNEAHNGRKAAERQAVAAQKRAADAEEQSLNAAKEMVVSGHAFTTQLKDLEAQNELLEEANMALIADIAGRRADKTMLEEVTSKLEKTFEDRERPLLIRLRLAEKDLALFSMKDADAISRLDITLAELQAEQTRIVAEHSSYRQHFVDLEAELSRVVTLRQDLAGAQQMADGQAKTLEQLVHTPASDGCDTPASSCSSEGSSSPSLSTATLSDDDFDMLFDASFEEEAQCGDIVDSATVRGLSDLGAGHTLVNQVGLGLIM